jgi:thymidylate kinase
MLIIVEGPDGVGKTTFVEGLHKYLEAREPWHSHEVIHRGVPWDHPLDEYVEPLISYRPGRRQNVIADRWHVGEWVYPSIFGRKTQADRAVWYYIEMFLQSRGALTVYLDDTDEAITERVRKRGDDLVTPEMTPAIATAFRFMRDQHLTTPSRVVMHTDSEYLENQYVQIVRRATMLECDAEKVSGFITFVGHPSATTLLVGDIRHNVTMGMPTTYHDRPAFMPYRATSGHFMLKHLQRPMLHTGLAMVNACDVDDLEEVIAVTQPLQVVALGNNATKKVDDLNFVTGFGAVPHPQYVRRFHHEHGDTYGTVIAQAARAQRDMRAWRP